MATLNAIMERYSDEPTQTLKVTFHFVENSTFPIECSVMVGDPKSNWVKSYTSYGAGMNYEDAMDDAMSGLPASED